MTASPFYPASACTVADLHKHPAFQIMMKKQMAGKLEKPQVFYELSRIAQDPVRFGDGIGFFDFLDECTSVDASDGTIEELIRMNVFRLVKDEHGSRLVPCGQIEEVVEKKAGRRMSSVYMLNTIHEAVKSRALDARISMSRVHELALAAYLGTPADPPV